MYNNLDGRCVLVTGATSGIGEETALRMGSLGARVIVTGRDHARGEPVVGAVREAGGRADFVEAHLHDARSARDLAGAALESADGKIDILVNNAGVGVLAPTAGFEESAFDELIDVNVKVPFYLVSELAPLMAERGFGVIVNVTTMAGQLEGVSPKITCCREQSRQDAPVRPGRG
jgi:NAD(P)-dependent dehydrogenase (short-subunit alcohol dehydrogenase family)